MVGTCTRIEGICSSVNSYQNKKDKCNLEDFMTTKIVDKCQMNLHTLMGMTKFVLGTYITSAFIKFVNTSDRTSLNNVLSTICIKKSLYRHELQKRRTNVTKKTL